MVSPKSRLPLPPCVPSMLPRAVPSSRQCPLSPFPRATTGMCSPLPISSILIPVVSFPHVHHPHSLPLCPPFPYPQSPFLSLRHPCPNRGFPACTTLPRPMFSQGFLITVMNHERQSVPSLQLPPKSPEIPTFWSFMWDSNRMTIIGILSEVVADQEWYAFDMLDSITQRHTWHSW